MSELILEMEQLHRPLLMLVCISCYLTFLAYRYFVIADTEKAGKQRFPILVVETVGEKQNEIIVKENEDLDAKIAKESLLAERVFEHQDDIYDGRIPCESHASSS